MDTAESFEHAATRTLIRRIFGGVQLIHDGQEIARYEANHESCISLARDGTLVFDHMDDCYRVDVGAPPPGPIRCGKAGAVVAPQGGRLLRWKRGSGGKGALISVDLQGRDATTIWQGDTRQVRRIDLSQRGAPGAAETADGLDDETKVLIADDGKTWAAIGYQRLALGRGARRTASVIFDDEDSDWIYLHWAFDLARDRILVAGAPGVTAIGFDGSVQAMWRSPEKCVSPPCIHGDEILVVVQTRTFQFAVKRLAARTLAYRDKLEALAHQDPSDEHTLLSLGDGSIAMVPRTGPILVAPARGTHHVSTSLVQVAGKRSTFVPPPAAPWYDAAIGKRGSKTAMSAMSPGERRSLARYLLEQLGDPGALYDLLTRDPDAFLPYADTVLSWDDVRLEQLRKTMRTWWRLGRGASGAAVAALVRRIAASPASRVLAAFLIESDHDAGLAELADFARKDQELAAICVDSLLDIPQRGPAIRRFSPKRRLVVIAGGAAKHRPTPGLSAMTPIQQVLPAPAGWSCRKPLHLVLGIDVALLADTPLAASPLKTQPFIQTSCDQCDESLESYVMAGKGKTATLIGTFDPASTRRPKRQCVGSGPDRAEVDRETRLSLVADEPGRAETVFATLGGRPCWLQSPKVPRCPRCRAVMFFVGQIDAGKASGWFTGTLYGFHCERCGVATQVMQCT